MFRSFFFLRSICYKIYSVVIISTVSLMVVVVVAVVDEDDVVAADAAELVAFNVISMADNADDTL
jgi:hypothetical protein